VPTIDELAVRLAAVEARLGMNSPPPPVPEPAPQPDQNGAPAKPARPDCVIGPDGRPALSWPVGERTTAWEVYDLLGAKTPVATVTEPRSVRSALKPGQHRRYAVVAVGPGGRSEMSDAIDIPAADTPAPSPTPHRERGCATRPTSPARTGT
jgi:hypothetical protein